MACQVQRLAHDRRRPACCLLVSRACLLATLAFLAYKLTDVGWGEIGRSIPTSPVFYLIFAVNFLLLPLAAALTYRLAWRFDYWRSCRSF